MVVVEIVEISKTRFEIILEERLSFILYKRELSRFAIEVGREISAEDMELIKTEILQKRAKKRALHLLEKRNRTEDNLRRKLAEGKYPEDVIDVAIDYVKSFSYLDDASYALRFIRGHMYRKSMREIKVLLQKKGIDLKTLEEAIASCYDEVAEAKAIRYLVEKKRYDASTATQKDRNKIYTYLMRKGFSYDCVRSVL
ncbi:MAG: RecX family transcriptional regulator [Lachnospiraceae bacterium]|nr:RecX family transcriptional regulator [Lachnospiraceae bacterium]